MSDMYLAMWATASPVFGWLAEKVLGGFGKALGWGWTQAQFAAAEDRYDQQVIRQYGSIRSLGQTTAKPLRDIFTDVYVLDELTDHRRLDADWLSELIWEQDRSIPLRTSERRPGRDVLNEGTKFVIQGKPGAGKTTFLRWLALNEAQRGAWGPHLGKTPIFVSLRDLALGRESVNSYIEHLFDVCGFPDAEPFIDHLLRSGRALVLFDGLDEVPQGPTEADDARTRITRMIEEFSQRYDGCHVVITCRTAATEHTFHPRFTYLEMADFEPDQVERFVRNWFWSGDDQEASTRLADAMLTELDAPEHEGIRDLARSPLLLTLLCLNYEETLGFPKRKVELYQDALDALLRRWDVSREIRRGGLYRGLSRDRKQQLFDRIAYDGLVNGQALFEQVDLEARIRAYLENVPEVPEAIDIDAGQVLREIIAQHGIFVQQVAGLYSFAHLTFQEYYAARYVVSRTASGTLEVAAGRLDDDRWEQVLTMIASMLPDAAGFVDALTKALFDQAHASPCLSRWLSLVAEADAALASPYRSVARRAFLAFGGVSPLHPDIGAIVELDSLVSFLEQAIATQTLVETPYPPAPEIERTCQIDLDALGMTVRAQVAVYMACRLDRELERDLALHSAFYAMELRYTTMMLAHRSLWSLEVRASNQSEPTGPRNDFGEEIRANLATIAQRAVTKFARASNSQGRAELATTVSALLPLGGDSSPEYWLTVMDVLRRSVYNSGEVLASLDRLERAAAELRDRWSTECPDDNRAGRDIVHYAESAKTVLDCLALAIVPDREALEDRLFRPLPSDAPNGVGI